MNTADKGKLSEEDMILDIAGLIDSLGRENFAMQEAILSLDMLFKDKSSYYHQIESNKIRIETLNFVLKHIFKYEISE